MKIKYLNKDLPENIFDGKEITIGREEDNSLQLLSDGISRHHGRIFYTDGKWYIEDLGSTNGIKLNGRKITAPEVLNENDTLDFYQEKLQVSDLTFNTPIIIANSTDTAKISISDVLQPAADNTASADPVIISTTSINSVPGSISLTPIAPAETDMVTEEVKKTDIDELARYIKQNTGNLFNNNKKTQNSPSQKTDAPKKVFSNKLFYVVLICVVIVSGAFLIKILEDKNKPVSVKKHDGQAAEEPLYLNYIKENISADNVFRFNLTIENKQASFSVDDLRSQLRYGPIVKSISDSELAKIKQTIKDSNFLTSPQVQPGLNSNQELEYKELEIYYGKKSNTITLKNRPTPRDFMDIEDALTLFTENCNLATISLSPEVLKEQAENSFKLANDKLANYETNLAFLKEAIDGYNITVEYLSGVSPEPEIRRVAAERLKRATTLRERWIKQYRSQYSTMLNKRDFEGAQNALQVLLSLYDENSKEYNVTKQRSIKLDILRRRQKTRKR